MQDVWQLLELAAIHHPGALAVVDCADPRRQLTYQQLYDRSVALAGYLRAQGLRRGDRLGLLSRNCSYVLELHFAAAALHAVVVNLNIHLAPRELAFILGDSAPCLLFADRAYATNLLAAAAEHRAAAAPQQQAPSSGSVVWLDVEPGAAAAQLQPGAEAAAGLEVRALAPSTLLLLNLDAGLQAAPCQAGISAPTAPHRRLSMRHAWHRRRLIPRACALRRWRRAARRMGIICTTPGQPMQNPSALPVHPPMVMCSWLPAAWCRHR